MIDARKVSNAIVDFCRNKKGWDSVFNNAPAGAQERLAISFYFSKYHKEFTPEDEQEYRATREEVEGNLTREDLEYLVKNIKKESARKNYQNLLDELNSGTAKATYGSISSQAKPQNQAEEQPKDVVEKQVVEVL